MSVFSDPDGKLLRCPKCHRYAIGAAELFACKDCELLVEPANAGRHTHNIAGVLIDDSTCPNCQASMPEVYHCQCGEIYDECGVGFDHSDEYTVHQTLWGGILKWLGIRK